MSISNIYHITTTYVATPRSIGGVLYGSAIFILLFTGYCHLGNCSIDFISEAQDNIVLLQDKMGVTITIMRYIDELQQP